MYAAPQRIQDLLEDFFHIILKYKKWYMYLMVIKKKNLLFVRGWDRKIHPALSLFSWVMTHGDRHRQIFYATVTLMIDSIIANWSKEMIQM